MLYVARFMPHIYIYIYIYIHRFIYIYIYIICACRYWRRGQVSMRLFCIFNQRNIVQSSNYIFILMLNLFHIILAEDRCLYCLFRLVVSRTYTRYYGASSSQNFMLLNASCSSSFQYFKGQRRAHLQTDIAVLVRLHASLNCMERVCLFIY